MIIIVIVIVIIIVVVIIVIVIVIIAIIVLLNALFLITYTIITSYYCGEYDNNTCTCTCIINIHAGIDEAGDTGDISLRDNLQKYCQSNRFVASRGALAGSFIFTGSKYYDSHYNHCLLVNNNYCESSVVYLFEIAIRLLAVGPFQYFGKKWNWYDNYDYNVVLIIIIIIIIFCLSLL